MRLGVVALILCSLVAFLAVGAVAKEADLQRGPAVMKPSPWPQQPGHTWNVGDGTATWTAPLTRPGATKQPTATFRWTLPASVPAAGAKGKLTITATAGDQDVFAPGFSINGALVRCTGISNTPSYGTGCADGARAAVGVALQPNETKTVSQEFLIRGAAGEVTVVTTAPQNVVYTYSGSTGPECAIKRAGLVKRPRGRPLARYGPIAVYARVPGLRVVFRNGKWELQGLRVARLADRWTDADCGGVGTIAKVAATSVINRGKPVATVGDRVFAPAIAHGCPSDPVAVVGHIVTGDPRIAINGRPVAVRGSFIRYAASCASNTGYVN